ncbi:MAG: VCBS repeat-containing protein [Chitinophagaceae bacterium]|nr:VCBS repeat-containing protein [Chitinophagaceae bacterium]
MKQCALLLCLLSWCACRDRREGMHFSLMKTEQTHIDFSNTITESDSLNVFIDEYMYNGSGVGVGDFNNDGLPDLFFAGSMVSSKLYINKGGFVFEDVTASAGLQTAAWCTGVSVVDINNDGYADIYVCVSHSPDAEKRRNLLFINDGKMHFTEEAEAYGLADTGYSTQAAFLDYDKDGDLDMYLLNHQIYSHTANDLRPKDTSGNAPAEDRLYRNDGVPAGMTHPVFHDVSGAAGIREDGYGLGVVVTDVNGDGWPDIYVANDYLANDLLWLNRRDGTFINVISTALRHQSYNSMGADAADINNDGLPDLAVVDMLPETNERKKMMFSATDQGKFDMQQRFGYEPSYVRNMLQLNNGVRAGVPFFSEIGQLAGVFQTDWSWSVLMADLDNDGWKDIYITNGLGKDVTNNDYATFAAAEGGYTGSYVFGEGGSGGGTFGRSGLGRRRDIAVMRKTLDDYGSVKMKSYLFRNNGGFVFSDVSGQAGVAVPAIANGAVYVDLDNDGDLDLVTNNINEAAFIWRNDIRASAKDSTHNFLAVQLRGPAGNTSGIGCKVMVFDHGKRQLLEQSPVRGFCSSVDSRLYFGLGDAMSVDSLYVQWPDGMSQVMRNVRADQWVTVWYREGPGPEVVKGREGNVLFSERPGPDFTHSESPHYDFGDHQPVLQKYSQMGPCIAVGDVNGDGLEDLFVGGAANQSGKIFIQGKDGGFSGEDLIQGIKPEEDLGAIFFDVDGDKDLDLLITAGSTEFRVLKYDQPRLYLNDGHGHFVLSPDALPVITDVTRAIAVADYDGDGDLDVFIGGRVSPGRYPQSPRSYILQNDHGKFRDVTATVCPALALAGMVTGAVFTDIDGDKRPDLVICGEWMGIRFFRNKGNGFEEMASLPEMHGLWRCLQAVDLDKDGDMDLVAGNMGLNNKYGVAPGRPMMLYAKDMDNNGVSELIPAYYIKDGSGGYQLYPGVDRNQLAQEVPAVKKKYLLHKDYSVVTMAQLKDDFGADGWTELTCETPASIWLENLGGGKFKTHVLPLQAQFAPVNSIVAEDVDQDGNVDLVMGGNEYQASLGNGRDDASYGLVLRGDGKGGFTPMDVAGSGLILDGDIRDMKIVRVGVGRMDLTGRVLGGRILIAAPNDGKLKTFYIK